MQSSVRARVVCLLLFESGLTYLCGVAALYIRFPNDATEVLVTDGGWARILLLLVVVQTSFYLFDLYDFMLVRQRVTLALRILQALGLASMLLAALFFGFPSLLLGRGVFLLAVVMMLGSMLCWRLFATWLFGHPRRHCQLWAL